MESGLEEWDFDIEESDPSSEPGVRIDVRELTEEASLQFSDESFRALRATLAVDYLLPLLQGLEISVNGVLVVPTQIEFRGGGDYAPMRSSYEDAGVKVEIVAGMHSAPPDTGDPEDPERADQISGWYVVCNGRIVLPANRDESTGWGLDGFPKWHHQYSGFIGFILFSAANPELLPMTTTKRDVDKSSLVYRRALVQLKEPARTWITYTNARKNNLEETHALESGLGTIGITSVPTRDSVAVPKVKKLVLRLRTFTTRCSSHGCRSWPRPSVI